MKSTTILSGFVFVLITSCATLNVNEIKTLEKVKFDSLSLIPDREVNNLRIDLIRQTYEKNVNDSTKETKEKAYHPIGFNLGNGLFCDLNKNLCLRIDYLLELSASMDFEIEKIDRPEKNKGITTYSFTNDSLLVRYPPGKRIHYRYHRIEYPDSTIYMYKKRLEYAIVEKDSSLIYSGKKRKWDGVYKIDDSNFYLNKRKRKENYQIKDNEVFLEKDYVISLSNNGSTIEIKTHRKKRKDRILYTIEKNNDKLFIYDKNYYGLLIERKGNSILIYSNKTLIKKYELKPGFKGDETSGQVAI